LTTFNGDLTPDTGEGVVAAARPGWLLTIGPWPTNKDGYLTTLALTGAHVNTQPMSARELTFAGVVAPSVNDQWYGRITVEPVRIDLGSLVSEQSNNVLVFNGFFTTQVLLTIDRNDFDSGMSFVGDATPTTYLPLIEKNYTLTVRTSGESVIDASIDFNWAGALPVNTVYITGSRITLLPVTFREGLVETLVWKTDIIESYDGSEQRVRARRAPRQQLRVTAHLDRTCRNSLENLLVGWRRYVWAVPMWIEGRTATASVTAGDTVVNVNTDYGDFRIGSLAVIWHTPTDYDVFQIEDMTGASLTMSHAANNDYAYPTIIPVRMARMTRDPVRVASGYDGALQADFEVTDNIAFDPAASPIQLFGEDFFDSTPLYDEGGEGVDDEYEHRIDLIDYATGATEHVSPWTHGKINRSFELVLEGLEDIWAHRQWLHRRAGALRPFYMTTYENNFQIVTTGTLLTAFEVVQNNYASQGTARNHIAFRIKATGLYIFRTVVGAVNQVGNTILITVDSAVGYTKEEIEEMSFVGLKRLASDRLSITWLPNNVALTQVPIKEIEH
jgi:hypothetical protein